MLFTCSPPQSTSAIQFFFSLPFPPSLCLCIISHLLLLSFGSFYHLNLRPFSMPTPVLPTASRPFPHLARRFPNECEAGIQGVCRCASLTGSAGAAAGRMCYLDPPRVSTTKACCGDWFLSPRPILTGAVCPLRGSCHVGGPVTCCDVWNALIVAFFLPSASISHIGVESQSISSFISGLCTNMQFFPFHIVSKIFMSLSELYICLSPQSKFT